MSTTKAQPKFVDGPFLKRFVIASGVVPALLLLWDAYRGQLGVNEVNFAIRTTGMVGLVFLVATLAVTPFRRLTGLSVSIAVRRNLGVFAFAYILGHFLIFVIWDRDGSIRSTVSEIIERKYLWFGFGSLLLMAPLAITSTDTMVSRLGAKRWKRLHRLAYPAAIAGVVHFYMLVKSDTTRPFVFAIVLGLFLATRLVPERKKKARAKRNFWSGELVLSRITQETHDVKTFRFTNPDGGALPFEHIAGQYLNLALTIDGRRVNRSYTIASPPTRRDYCEISVKRAIDGYGSHHLHDTWKEGQRIKISAPAGKFHFSGDGKRIVLIAGGIGITPMMSVVRAMTDRGWAGELYLVFSVRLVKDIVFREEIAQLQAAHRNLKVLITVTNDADNEWPAARGQISRELLEGFIPSFTSGPVMLCGPDKMMTAMRQLLVGMGIPDAEIHQEAFISPKALEPAAGDAATADEVIDETVERSVHFKQADKRIAVTNGLTVLECAEDAGVDIPSECRSGICGQCKTRLVTGKVVMEVQDALTNADRAKGLILACQARPVRDVEIDA